jgi:hypothetical protein
MSRKMTPEEVLDSVVEGVNTRESRFLMTLEADACFASQLGHLAKTHELVYQSPRSFSELKGELESKQSCL